MPRSDVNPNHEPLYGYEREANMRTARIKPRGVTCYHVCSRVVDRGYRLTGEEKRAFLGLMRRVEAFYSVST